MAGVLHEGQYVVAMECPQCHLLASVLIGLAPRLTAERDGATMRVVVKQKGAPHVCGQAELHSTAPGEDEAGGILQPALDWAERAAGGRDED